MVKQILSVTALLLCVNVQAAVTSVEANSLGNDLTPVGATLKGNGVDIPDWTGSMRDLPEALAFRGSSRRYIDPYVQDPVLYTVTESSSIRYQKYLTDGLKAMLALYPQTFKIPVYPTRRNARYNAKFEKRTLWNSKNTLLKEGNAGISQYTGAIPFPIPKNGQEVMWNARLAHPNASLNGVLDTIAVYPNGTQHRFRERMVSEYPYANENNKVGLTEKDIGAFAALVHVAIEEPRTEKGNMTMVQEPLYDVEDARQAWVYMQGIRRVRRLPSLGFDAPYGPGGIMTIDDLLGFNGSMERFTWKLIGKEEKIIPFHNYHFDSPDVGYGRLLRRSHVNPDFMRYEKHRVWVVEANLKENRRHIYQKRRFYIAEDSWQIVLTESYDRNGRLWKVGVLNSVYDFDVQGYVTRVQMHHDLLSKSYVATRLFNETSPPNLKAKPQGLDYFQPANLRKEGTR